MKNSAARLLLVFHFILAIALLLAPAGLRAEITPAEIRKTEAKVQKLARESLPATVSLIPGGDAPRFGTGSGVIVDKSGLILTAAHVAMEMNEIVTVIFPNGDRATAKVLGMDFSRDAAMLQITDKGEYPYVEVGESDDKEDNDWCIALGHASGFQSDRSPPIRLGRVISNNPKTFLMSDCTLIAGDSGGPLFDIDGKLIGIHSSIGFSLSQNNHVPISTFVKNWDRLKKGDRFGNGGPGGLQNPNAGTLGARIGNNPDGDGALVRRVLPDSPAEKAGLKKGDIIVGVGDSKISNRQAIQKAVNDRQAGDAMKLSVRSKKEAEIKEIEIKLAAAAKFPERRRSARPNFPLPEGRPEAKPKEEPKSDSKPAKDKEADRPKETNSDTSKKEDIPPAKTRTEKERKVVEAEFKRKLRESLDAEEFLLEKEDFDKLESPMEFMKYLKEFQNSLDPEEAEKFAKMIQPGWEKPVRPGNFDPDAPIPVRPGFYRDVLNAFRPSVAGASDATHLVFRGNDWTSLGTVVHPDGFVVTKASDVETGNNQALTVMLAKDKLIPAEIVKTFPASDLALLKLKKSADLTPVNWSDSKAQLPLGSFIAAAGSGPDAIAIGVVSVQPRSLSGRDKGFLGISAAPNEKGVRVAMVVPNSSAGEAGVQRDDIITKIGDAVCDTPEKLIKLVSGTAPGETITLHYLREGKAATLDVTLGDREDLDRRRGDPSGMMNRMGTELSRKRSGYPSVLQSDLPIRPQECGGPVVDLDGNAIGINIARAGRIKTYAIPAEEVRKLIEPEIERIRKADAKKPAPKAAEKKKESAAKAN